MTASLNNVITTTLLPEGRSLPRDNMNIVAVMTSQQGKLSTFNRYESYTQISAVASDFGTTSQVYQHATAFFGTQPNAVNAGGLFVVGTERMESRRVDNQARGRSGRQGDEGSSIFYVSLEDDLMRIFGSESMNKMLEKLGLKDGESIDHPWINKALERAQQKVEARNFDIRKTLIKFDNVLNDQRHVVFSQRKNAMNSQSIFDYSDEFLKEIIDDIIKLKIQSLSNPKSNEFSNRLKQIVGKSFDESELKSLISAKDAELKEKIINKFSESRDERIKILGEDHAAMYL